MSWQYESLSLTSELPGWISEADLDMYWLLELGAVHGKERRSKEIVREHQASVNCPSGVLPVIANHAAVEQDERFIDKPQLMAWFPGNFAGIANEDRTAAGISWLVDQLDPQHIVLDWHTNNNGTSFNGCGRRVSAAALAASYLLNPVPPVHFDAWSTFYQNIPRAASVEDGRSYDVASETARRQEIGQALATIIELRPKGLQELYFDEIVHKLSFMQTILEVELVDPATYRPNPDVMAVLDELETCNLSEGNSGEIDLSLKARKVLGLQEDTRYFATSAHYHNQSPVIDSDALRLDALPDGRQRLLAWGAIHALVQPPTREEDGDMVVFDAA